MSSLQAAGARVTPPRGSGGRAWSTIAALSMSPLVLLLLLGVVYSILGARKSAERARHTDEVRVELLRLQAKLIDAETGQRGYVATGDPLFLEPYARGVRDWRAMFDEVRKSAADNPSEEGRLDELQSVIERKLEELRSGVDARRQGVSGAALVPLLSGGKEMMDDIRSRIAAMLRDEDALARRRVASATRLSTLAISGLLFATFLVVVGVAWVLAARRAEQTAQEREQHDAALVRGVIDNFPALAWSALPDGRNEFSNREWAEYTGMKLVADEPEPWLKAVDPDMLARVLDRWRRSLASGEPSDMEMRLRGKDGVFRWFLTRSRPLRDLQGRIERWVGCGVNIDDAKRYEGERKVLLEREHSARQEAERAAKLAELFVAVLGHDLRNPLSAIQMQGQLLERAGDERSQRAGTRITSSADRMARMITQILDFSRIRSGQGLPQKPTAIDVRDVLSRVVQELSGTTGRGRVRIEADGDTRGRWDEDRLGQVFSNLVANALEHSPEGSPVRLSVDGRDAGRVAVAVENPGCIPPELVPELFEPFRKARPEAKSRGLGLGLYITKQIVEAHGGTIDVSTSADAGTRFLVVLPRESAGAA